MAKKLKDVLESEVDDKYYLSNKQTDMIKTENSQAIEWIADYRNDEGLRIRKDGNSPCMMAVKNSDKQLSRMPPIINQEQIRRLTPRECFRLQDFDDSFTWTCSDSQAYKQAGNSITVGVLEKLLNKLLHL